MHCRDALDRESELGFNVPPTHKSYGDRSSLSLIQKIDALQNILYFFGYKKEFLSFQNNPNNLDPSYKMDLDLWDC